MEDKKHSPLPWYSNPYYIIYGADDIIVADTDDEEQDGDAVQANAEFIVRACNSYYELANKCDTLTERSMGAMQIAEGDEGWERIEISCPMMLAVRDLRVAYEAAITEAEGKQQ